MERRLPLVSIAMATYNGEKFIEEQIHSLIEQDYPCLEIVIVDDKSTDRTWEILQDWHFRHQDKIKIYRNDQNIGFNRNFSKALSLCKGQYIAIADQDDVWVLNKISKLVALFEQDVNIMLIHHKDDHIVDGKTQKQVLERYHWRPYEGNNPKPLFFTYRMGGHSMMFNSVILNQILPIPDGILYDWWILMISVVNGRVAYCDDDLVHFRFHPDSAHFGKKDRNKNIVNEINHALKLFGSIQLFTDADKKFLEKFSKVYHRHATKFNHKFDIKLFLFFLAHKKNIFGLVEGPNPLAREIYVLRLCRVYAKM